MVGAFVWSEDRQEGSGERWSARSQRTCVLGWALWGGGGGGCSGGGLDGGGGVISRLRRVARKRARQTLLGRLFGALIGHDGAGALKAENVFALLQGGYQSKRSSNGVNGRRTLSSCSPGLPGIGSKPLSNPASIFIRSSRSALNVFSCCSIRLHSTYSASSSAICSGVKWNSDDA